jgi:phage terminase large subunit-like protein
MLANNLKEADIDQLNYFDSFATYKPTWTFHRMIRCEQEIIAMFTGNQAGKTSGVAFQYVLRILGLHPIVKKNVLYFECDNKHVVSYPNLPKNKKCKECGKIFKEHKRGSRVFRFAAENLPGQSKDVNTFGMSAEVRNTQYPEFKKWLPSNLIKSDITSRSASMIIQCPFGGDDILIDFVSYGQRVQGTAGPQRLSVWLDEESPYDFYTEQLPRLIAEEGDLIISLTPANHITWTYDTIFEKAEVYYKTDAICEFLRTKDYTPQNIEKNNSNTGIAVLQSSTYDNPTLKHKIIEGLLSKLDDDDEKAIRMYGIFKQVSGRIFKDFNKKVHVISKQEYFPYGVNQEWSSFRACDYHPQTLWAIVFMSSSDKNELFIWGNCNPFLSQRLLRRIQFQ